MYPRVIHIELLKKYLNGVSNEQIAKEHGFKTPAHAVYQARASLQNLVNLFEFEKRGILYPKLNYSTPRKFQNAIANKQYWLSVIKLYEKRPVPELPVDKELKKQLIQLDKSSKLNPNVDFKTVYEFSGKAIKSIFRKNDIVVYKEGVYFSSQIDEGNKGQLNIGSKYRILIQEIIPKKSHAKQHTQQS